MANFKVTLKASLKRGDFYWVCDVSADSEEEALVAAENLFSEETEKAGDWTFDEFDIQTGDE